MLQREESRHDFAFIAGVVIGAAAGAIATLALAPAAGSDTRDKVRQSVTTLDVDSVKQRATTLSGTARDAAARGKSTVTTTAQTAAQRGKGKVSELAAMRGGSSSDEWIEEATDVAESVDVAGDTLVEETVTDVSAAVAESPAEGEKPGPD
jgi:gas vesicle protein